MNLVKAYMEYKRNLILDLIYYLSPDLKDTNSINIIDKFIDTYFQAYYFHSLQTLDKSEKTKYNYSTIKQELYGMKIEIEYDKEYESNLITKIYKLILISIKIIHSMYTLDDLKECISKNKIDVEAEKILKLIEDYNKKEAKFINALTIDDFKLNIILYSNKKDLYKCELVTDINQLTKHYSDISISVKPSVFFNFQGIKNIYQNIDQQETDKDNHVQRRLKNIFNIVVFYIQHFKIYPSKEDRKERYQNYQSNCAYPPTLFLFSI